MLPSTTSYVSVSATVMPLIEAVACGMLGEEGERCVRTGAREMRWEQVRGIWHHPAYDGKNGEHAERDDHNDDLDALNMAPKAIGARAWVPR